ncbi:hypothetical protein [Devosia sp.]|uniref:hypothetical protein n=1 Tax=Devosia sp. TaxID=1871048 RepID=UPI001AD5067C|nr:hypothetical protein [Devosia sp.]MBN9332134.1 hypothetical protein [Devosia sp.]
MTTLSDGGIDVSYRTHLADGRFSLPALFCISLLIFGVSAFVAFLLRSQAGNLADLGFSGLAVPDAFSLEQAVYQVWTTSWHHIPNLNTFFGVAVLYFPMTLWGSGYVVVANVAMLAVSVTVFYSILEHITPAERLNGSWLASIILVSTNLYLVACLFYPNKEVPLILLTTLALWGLIYGKWPLVMLLVLLCFWFRDGYALILGMVLVVALSRRFAFVSGGIISCSFLVLLFLAFPIADLSAVDASIQRNVEIGSLIAGDKFSALGDVAAYLARLVGNAFNLGLRPQIADVRGGIYLLGVGYWQFGIVLLAGLVWSARNVLTDDISRGITALVSIVVLLGISYGTFVQPRYMMPLIFPLTLGLSETVGARYLSIGAAVLLPLLFLFAGMLPPLADG